MRLTTTIFTICLLLLICSCGDNKTQQNNYDFSEKVKEALQKKPESIRLSVKKHIIEANDSMNIELPHGQNVIYSINAEVRGDVKDISIHASFDNTKTVDVPFSYFTDSTVMSCNDYMPYLNSSNFTIINHSKQNVDATLSIKTISMTLDKEIKYYRITSEKMLKK